MFEGDVRAGICEGWYASFEVRWHRRRVRRQADGCAERCWGCGRSLVVSSASSFGLASVFGLGVPCRVLLDDELALLPSGTSCFFA